MGFSSAFKGLTSILDGVSGQFRSGRFTPGKEPGTHWVWRWVGARAVLKGLEGRNVRCPCRQSDRDISVVQSAAFWGRMLCIVLMFNDALLQVCAYRQMDGFCPAPLLLWGNVGNPTESVSILQVNLGRDCAVQ